MSGLLDLRMGTILASFPVVGTEKLLISVRALMSFMPRCFRCKIEMPSGSADDDGLTNHLCCKWWRHVCVLENGVQIFEYASVLSSLFCQHIYA